MTKLYPYQLAAIDDIFKELGTGTKKVLFQLPTGGGKTVIFSEIVRRYIESYSQKAAILTHRSELCRQTSATLRNFGVDNKVISAKSKTPKPDSQCYVAMVETLKNRIKSKSVAMQGIGLIIIDEAHHNSFRKLFKNFKDAFVIGVTATPFSADVSKPMNRYYQSLIVGENIASLIDSGFLARPKSFACNVELNSLKTGIHGDYTVSSSNELYGSQAMLDLLFAAYADRAAGKKTLIFNNGIATSLKVCELFAKNGIDVKHLDNTATDAERKEILQWFRKTKGAVLTSVSILTTGFDEPSIRAVILNRATTSVTLYHQMVGRGARRLPSKKTFSVIDLGNNIDRFGDWHEPVDWEYVFKDPEGFAAALQYHSAGGAQIAHGVPAALKSLFPNTLEFTFDICENFEEAVAASKKPKTVIRQSIRQHALMCLANAGTLSDALKLSEALAPEIEWRVKTFVKCLEKATASYKTWLLQDYKDRLDTLIRKLFAKHAEIPKSA